MSRPHHGSPAHSGDPGSKALACRACWSGWPIPPQPGAGSGWRAGMARARAGWTSSRARPFGITPACRCRSAGCWCVTWRVRKSRRLSCAPTWMPTPVDILRWFVRRWRGETTFEEARRHLGLETQRQWSDLAILRTTPALLGLFSLVTLWATQLEAAQRLLPEWVRWYPKRTPTFSDALALVRRELWMAPTFAASPDHRDILKVPADVLDRLMRVACRPP